MQNNFYFLKQLSKAIAAKLQLPWVYDGQEVIQVKVNKECYWVTAFSQEKDELIIGIDNNKTDFYCQISLQGSQNLLYFPDQFMRAKRNSIDLFTALAGLRIEKVEQFAQERAFALHFEQDYCFVFKLFGRQANLILFEKGNPVGLFHKRYTQDLKLSLAQLDRQVNQSEKKFKSDYPDIKNLFPTFTKEMWEVADKQYLHTASEAASAWEGIQNFIETLEEGRFFVTNLENTPTLLCYKPLSIAENDYQVFDDPIEAVNFFYQSFSKLHHLQALQQESLKTLQKKRIQTLQYLEKNKQRLAEIETGSRQEEIGHILMANLHQIPEKAEKVELFDFYREQPILIKLKKDLSAQKNAENYYRKAKNEKIELETLRTNQARKTTELTQIEQDIVFVQQCSDYKSLAKYIKNRRMPNPAQKSVGAQTADLFKRFFYQGFDIWVGKNAKNNDLLTQKYAHKDDLWLHAKDVSGSHVVVKHQSGKPFPKDVIEKAASLAAFYSKRSNDTLCPVIYTLKKYVRKTKDLAPGQVLVEKEDVVMVVPERF